MKRAFFAMALAACLVTAPALALPEVGKPAPHFTSTDALGKNVSLSDFKGKLVVLEWSNPGCPFVKKHYESGNMQKLHAYAKEKGVVWLTINSSAEGKQGHMNPVEAKAFVESTRHQAAHYLLDGEGKIGRLYGAKNTPHMFVIDSAGNIAYMGAIDDKPSTDQADIPGAKNYVMEALDSLMQSKPVETVSTQPYGCSVKYVY